MSDIPDNFKTNLPHQIKLEKKKQDKNNFINSTIHCLTNIISFLKQVSSSQMSDYSYPIFYSFFLEMSQVIMNTEEKEKDNLITD